MKYDLLHKPDSAIAHIHLDPREELIAEAGAMVAMSSTLQVNTTLRKGKGGGVLGGLKRVLAGESLFLSVFRTGTEPGEIYLAPKLMGDILAYSLPPGGLVVQSTGFMACTPKVQMDIGFQGLKSLFAGESIFWLDVSGSGLIWLSSFGAIYEVEVNGDYIVDTGHVVAFEKTLKFSVTKAGSSWLGSLLGIGGEGLVLRFQGQGKVFCQTHSPAAFGMHVGGRLRPR
ncbi:MAG: TIGR00266 family protein [Cyanobacteriota bacterium]|nr:TIGR00266 family protein [Cyanobacteriota bacterium]